MSVRPVALYSLPLAFFLLFVGLANGQEPFERSNGPVIEAAIEFAGSIPDDYWANDMEPGEVRIIDGVVHRALPAPGQVIGQLDEDDRLALGLPRSDLVAYVAGDSEADAEKRRSQRTQYAEWIIENEFSDLPTDRKADMRATLIDVAQQATEIEASMREEELTEERIASIRRQYADLLAVLFIAQREAYRGLSDLQREKFGEVIDYSTGFPDRAELGEKFLAFLQGTYLKEEALTVATAQTSAAAISDPSNIARVTTAERISTQPSLDTEPRIRTVEIQEGAPQPVAVEGRIFVTSSPLSESVWPLTELVHTNVIAGYWILNREKKIVEQYRVSPPPTNAVETEAAAMLRQRGTLVSRERHTTLAWRFHRWMWANGAAGEYEIGDDLRLVEKTQATNNWEAANKALFSYTGLDGRYCRNRATSYSVGMYGTNFVCHQTANAFMRNRRGYEPVDHWYSNLLFGSHGNFGISTCATIITNSAMKGCIPGNWCQGNHFPYVIENLWSLAFELAPGYGWGLSDVWHQGRQQWIGSQARYNSAEVPIPGKDDEVFTVVEDLLAPETDTAASEGVQCPTARPVCCHPLPSGQCRSASECISTSQHCP